MKKFFKKLKPSKSKVSTDKELLDQSKSGQLAETDDSQVVISSDSEKSPDSTQDKSAEETPKESKEEQGEIASSSKNSRNDINSGDTSFSDLVKQPDEPESKEEKKPQKENRPPEEENEKPIQKQTKLLTTPKKPEPKKEKGFLDDHIFDLQELEKNTSLWFREISKKTFWLTHLVLLIGGLILIGYLGYYLHSDQVLYDIHTSAPITKPPISFSLTINNPEDHLLTYEQSIIVSGQTSPNSTIIITNNDQTTALEANSKGDFSKVLVLEEGVNQMVISSFDKAGNNKTIERSIYFTEEELPE